MATLLIILAVIVCFFLGLIVLIQNPKGGGLSSNFSSSSQLMGVQKTGDFLEKGTWFLAIALMVLSLGINVAIKGSAGKTDTGVDDKIIENASKAAAPTSPQSPVIPTSASKAADSAKK